jgi:DNA-binding response OmpR family regulator
MNGTENHDRLRRAEIEIVMSTDMGASDELMVLLVNPAPELLDELSALLKRRGVAVLKALDPADALRLLQNVPRIGVVVLDIHQLQGEGLTLATRLLHGDPGLPAAELVLLTEPRLVGAGSGVDVGMAPFRLRDVAANVGRALGQAAARRAA